MFAGREETLHSFIQLIENKKADDYQQDPERGELSCFGHRKIKDFFQTNNLISCCDLAKKKINIILICDVQKNSHPYLELW